MNWAMKYLVKGSIFCYLFSMHLWAMDNNRLYPDKNLKISLGDGFYTTTMTRKNGVKMKNKQEADIIASYSDREVSYSYIYNDSEDKTNCDQNVLDVFLEFQKNSDSSNKTQIVVYRRTTYHGTINPGRVDLDPNSYQKQKDFEKDYGDYYVRSAKLAQYIIAFVEIEEADNLKKGKIKKDLAAILGSGGQPNEIPENSMITIRTKYIGVSKGIEQVGNFTNLGDFNAGMKGIDKIFSDDSGMLISVELAPYDPLISGLFTQTEKSESLFEFENIKDELYLINRLANYNKIMYQNFLKALNYNGNEDYFIISNRETINELSQKFERHIDSLGHKYNAAKEIDTKNDQAMDEFIENYYPEFGPLPALLGDYESYLKLFLFPINFKTLKQMADGRVDVELPEYIVFIGSLGVGKSAILNTLVGKKKFKTGLGSGDRNNDVLDYKHDGKIFVDTPGLSKTDIQHRAGLIRNALLKKGRYRIFFVLTLKENKLNPNDVATMELVSNAIENEGKGFNVIINNIIQEKKKELEEDPEMMTILYDQLSLGNNNIYKKNIFFIKKNPKFDGSCLLEIDANLKKLICSNSFVFTLKKDEVKEFEIDNLENRERFFNNKFSALPEIVKRPQPNVATKNIINNTSSDLDEVYNTLFNPKEIYNIRSVSSKKYLDGRGHHSDENVLMTARKPHGDKFLQWRIKRLSNKKFTFQSVSSDKYLTGSGRNDNDIALVTTGDPNASTGDNLQWDILFLKKAGRYSIKSVKSGKYLDGRKSFGDSKALVSDKSPDGSQGICVRWEIEKAH